MLPSIEEVGVRWTLRTLLARESWHGTQIGQEGAKASPSSNSIATEAAPSAAPSFLIFILPPWQHRDDTALTAQ